MTARSLIKEHGPNCWICGLVCDFRLTPQRTERKPLYRRMKATVDHYIPRSKGGTSSRSNLRLAHGYCNSKRGSDDFTVEIAKKCRAWMLYNVPSYVRQNAEDWYLRNLCPRTEPSGRLAQPEPDWWSTQPEMRACDDLMYRAVQGGLCNGR